MCSRAGSFVWSILLTFALILVSFAQDHPKVYVTAVSPSSGFTEDQSVVLNALTLAFEAKHAHISYKLPEWTLVVDAIPLDSSRYVISSVLLQGLPAAVVDFAKENEVFYLVLPEEKRKNLPPEGKHVREVMSEEFVRQFGNPVETRIAVVKRTDVNTFAAGVVADFFTQHLNY